MRDSALYEGFVCPEQICLNGFVSIGEKWVMLRFIYLFIRYFLIEIVKSLDTRLRII